MALRGAGLHQRDPSRARRVGRSPALPLIYSSRLIKLLLVLAIAATPTWRAELVLLRPFSSAPEGIAARVIPIHVNGTARGWEVRVKDLLGDPARTAAFEVF
jgi:hypothetical protein